MISFPCNFQSDQVIYKYWNIPLKLEGENVKESGALPKYIMFASGGMQFFLSIEKVERIASSKEQIEDLEVFDLNFILWGESRRSPVHTKKTVASHVIILKMEKKRYGLLVEAVSGIKSVKDDERIPFKVPACNEHNRYLEYVVYQQNEVPSLIYIIEPVVLYEVVRGEYHVT